MLVFLELISTQPCVEDIIVRCISGDSFNHRVSIDHYISTLSETCEFSFASRRYMTYVFIKQIERMVTLVPGLSSTQATAAATSPQEPSTPLLTRAELKAIKVRRRKETVLERMKEHNIS